MATVKELFENNTSLVVDATALLNELSDRSGQYAWKMCEYDEALASEITVTHIQGGGVDSCIIQFSSDEIDFSTLDESIFVGMVLESANMGTINLDETEWTWDASTQQMSFSFVGTSVDTWTVTSPSSLIVKGSASYVTADDGSAYPEDGIQGDYYYEILKDTSIKKFTLSGTIGYSDKFFDLGLTPNIISVIEGTAGAYDLVPVVGFDLAVGDTLTVPMSSVDTYITVAEGGVKIRWGYGSSTTFKVTFLAGDVPIES